jgi:hypothetical protein
MVENSKMLYINRSSYITTSWQEICEITEIKVIKELLWMHSTLIGYVATL